eukprot:TRINITY_DN113406_c0_g1_i1.p1 TRINITY_DN113406_c0_g1~~TRINITY_DN113406_c0_g1_i1.p1  ORF type:complete len:118 (+),score=30.89 TRINITY_DN113406_c0_g1_i1:130-483(+)
MAVSKIILRAALFLFIGVAAEEPAGLSLIQNKARKIVKGKIVEPPVPAAAVDAMDDLNAGGGLSLMQGSCANSKGARRVSKKLSKKEKALAAAVMDGVEEGYATLALYQENHVARRR